MAVHAYAWQAIIFCLSSFFSDVVSLSMVTERYPTNFATCSEVSQVRKWLSKIWGSLPLTRWAQICLVPSGFSTISQLKCDSLWN